jgi:hypothetical protein
VRLVRGTYGKRPNPAHLCCAARRDGYSPRRAGEVAEWLKAHAWKACIRETVSRVRIPLSPPASWRMLPPAAKLSSNEGGLSPFLLTQSRTLADYEEGKAMSDDDLKAELERLRQENATLKKGAASGLRLKVSEKGAISVYGMGRFPVTLYKEQWLKLLTISDDIRAFIAANEGQLKTKNQD